MTTRSVEAQLVNLPIEQLQASSTNPRRHFDAESMEDLKRSIAAMGIQVPLLVRPSIPRSGVDGVFAADEAQFEVVAGGRRFRAATDLALDTVPCIVRELDDAEAREAQIVENLQRADVHPLEEAEAYRLMSRAAIFVDGEPVGDPLTAEGIAKRVGKTTAYVAKRLKLIALSVESKDLYVRGHLTEGHALLLARLMLDDQTRALRFMLNIDPKYDKRTIQEQVRKALGLPDPDAEIEPKPAVGDEDYDELLDGEDGNDEGGTSPGYGYNMQKPQRVMYMREGRALIAATEAQLKRWIESNILLKLSDVPWRLDDDQLTPAGACVDCPKRSGSNAALFGDLTAEDDVCLDPACFAAKQDATLKQHKAAAKAQCGYALLKISSKKSFDKLEEPAFTKELRKFKDPDREIFFIQVTKKTVRAGQWLAAEPESCYLTLQGVMVDGGDKGKLFSVCANQTCQVHKHEVRSVSSGSGANQAVRHDPAAEQRAQEECAHVEKVEEEIRAKVFRAIVGKLAADPAKALRLVADEDDVAPANRKDLLKEFPKLSGDQLEALTIFVGQFRFAAQNVNGYWLMNEKTGVARDREDTWKLAKSVGVDADAVAAKHFHDVGSVAPVLARLYPKGVKWPGAAKAEKQIPSGNDKKKTAAAAKKKVVAPAKKAKKQIPSGNDNKKKAARVAKKALRG